MTQFISLKLSLSEKSYYNLITEAFIKDFAQLHVKYK